MFTLGLDPGVGQQNVNWFPTLPSSVSLMSLLKLLFLQRTVMSLFCTLANKYSFFWENNFGIIDYEESWNSWNLNNKNWNLSPASKYRYIRNLGRTWTVQLKLILHDIHNFYLNYHPAPLPSPKVWVLVYSTWERQGQHGIMCQLIDTVISVFKDHP